MNYQKIILLILISISSFQINAQDTTGYYEIDFHKTARFSQYLPTNLQYSSLWKTIKKTEMVIAIKKNDGPSFFTTLEILNKDKGQLFRLLAKCDDCKRTYVLFYQSGNNILVIKDATPTNMISQIFKLFEKSSILLKEEDVKRIIKEVFFYQHYHQFYRTITRLPPLVK